jgi:hypothetical protein
MWGTLMLFRYFDMYKTCLLIYLKVPLCVEWVILTSSHKKPHYAMRCAWSACLELPSFMADGVFVSCFRVLKAAKRAPPNVNEKEPLNC